MTITDQAQEKITEVLNGDGYLGIYVEGGGCSGYRIKLSPSGTLPTDATMITENIFSDGDSINLLGDAVMDWEADPFRPTFKFIPPTGAHSCGCGSSFAF
jgi:iron-sulfur cluster assembly accessory protein